MVNNRLSLFIRCSRMVRFYSLCKAHTLQKKSFADVPQKCVLKISQISQENICVGASSLKSDFNTGVSCENYEIFKNAIFTEHVRWLLLMLVIWHPGLLFYQNNIRCFHFFWKEIFIIWLEKGIYQDYLYRFP